MNEQHKDIGKEIIQKLGTSHYIMWSYLENRNFTILSIDEIAQDLGRHGRTIQRWLKDLQEHGYINKVTPLFRIKALRSTIRIESSFLSVLRQT